MATEPGAQTITSHSDNCCATVGQHNRSHLPCTVYSVHCRLETLSSLVVAKLASPPQKQERAACTAMYILVHEITAKVDVHTPTPGTRPPLPHAHTPYL